MKKLKKPLFVVFLCGLICLIGCANRTVSDSKPKLSLAKHFNGLFYLGAARPKPILAGVPFHTPFLVGNSTTFQVQMATDNSLDEVVVVAFASKKRKELTSAVSVVSGEDLAKLSPTTSIDNMLQGIAPSNFPFDVRMWVVV